MKRFLPLLTLLLIMPQFCAAQSVAEEEAVRRAVLDYVEGFYEGDTEKITRGVSENVTKEGFMRRETTGPYRLSPMTFEQMLSYATSVRESGRMEAEDAVKIVEVFDVADQTASAKLTATWGQDYLLLGRMNGEWKVMQVLWQTPPPPGN